MYFCNLVINFLNWVSLGDKVGVDDFFYGFRYLVENVEFFSFF